ncbi:hypothetical protein J6590_061670 [Homalodisca vitripennis]|nr:hypothetical protein J6590_061670 [Homalodisca vitripennis]
MTVPTLELLRGCNMVSVSADCKNAISLCRLQERNQSLQTARTQSVSADCKNAISLCRLQERNQSLPHYVVRCEMYWEAEVYTKTPTLLSLTGKTPSLPDNTSSIMLIVRHCLINIQHIVDARDVTGSTRMILQQLTEALGHSTDGASSGVTSLSAADVSSVSCQTEESTTPHVPLTPSENLARVETVMVACQTDEDFPLVISQQELGDSDTSIEACPSAPLPRDDTPAVEVVAETSSDRFVDIPSLSSNLLEMRRDKRKLTDDEVWEGLRVIDNEGVLVLIPSVCLTIRFAGSTNPIVEALGDLHNTKVVLAPIINCALSANFNSEGTHWSLVIIDVVRQEFQHMDSLPGLNHELALEFCKKVNSVLMFPRFVFKNRKCKKQLDDFSCGYEVVKNARSQAQYYCYKSKAFDLSLRGASGKYFSIQKYENEDTSSHLTIARQRNLWSKHDN